MVSFDRDEITRAIGILKPEGELYEVRIVKGLTVMSGYFSGADALVKELQGQDLARANVYMTIQQLHEGCAARWQWNCFINASREKLPTTSDKDITRYKFIPIDLDPVRPAGISSTEEELRHAHSLCPQIVEYMSEQGFKDYVYAFSGNGYHLLYRVDMPNNEESVQTMQGYLRRLDEVFSNEFCHVDTTTYNPARVLKLYGTIAQKGRYTENRPHRMSKILRVHHGTV